jgi:hypothetical protein
MGEKKQQNFLNIDSKYNAKIKDQTQENIQHWAMCLSLPSSDNYNFPQTCALDE